MTILRQICPTLAIACGVLSSLAAGEAPSGWPGWRGPAGNGFSPETGLNQDWKGKLPKTLWSVTLVDKGYSGVAATAGLAVLVDHEGKQDVIRAIDLATGTERWRHAYDDGEKYNYGFNRATPAIDAGKVYVAGRFGQVVCVSLAEGKPVWNANLVTDFGGRFGRWEASGSPLIDGDRVVLIAGGENAAVVAYDKSTGKPVFKGGNDKAASYSSPAVAVIGGVKQYVVFSATQVAGVDVTTGTQLWSSAWATKHDCNAPTPIAIGASVLIASGYDHGSALIDLKNGTATTRWTSTEFKPHFNTPIVHDGHLYGATDPYHLVCLEISSGKVKWKADGWGKGGVVGFGSAFIAVDGRTGDLGLFKLDPTACIELGRIPVPVKGQNFWTTPIIAEGKLLVRSQTALTCIDLK